MSAPSADSPTSPRASRPPSAVPKSDMRTKDSRTKQIPCRSAARRSSKAGWAHAQRHRREAVLRHLEPEAENPPLRHTFRSARRFPDQSMHRSRTRHLSSNRFWRVCGKSGLRSTRRLRMHQTENHSAHQNQMEQTEAQSPSHHSSHPRGTHQRHRQRMHRKRRRITSKRQCTCRSSEPPIDVKHPYYTISTPPQCESCKLARLLLITAGARPASTLQERLRSA